MEKLKPKLFSVMKTYTKEQFVKDVVAGIIVAIIALPLSIALALASGVGPEQGIYTAIVAGFLISFFGGSRVQIAGPTAAFATIVAGIVAQKGMDGLIVATILAGIILVVMGFLRLGNLIKYIPFTITTGFTAGIAVTIAIGQIKDFLGLTYPAGTPTIETMEKAEAVIKNIATVNWQALIVGLVCLAILILWPYINKTIPGSLIAVIAGIAMVKFLNMDVNTIGDLYEISNKLPGFHLPHVTLGDIGGILPDAFTIAILAAIESLLSCVVADSMINSKHRSNMELIAQGIGNIGSALFGGIPATGAIARTAANIKNGGRTPVAGMVHAVTLVLILVVLMPYAALIPMPCIAAILFMVAYNMCGWRTFVNLCKSSPKSDIIVLVTTFILTVVFDLVVAIEVGILLAAILFMKRMSDVTSMGKINFDASEKTAQDIADPDATSNKEIPEGVEVYEINGPFFFGVADMLINTLEHIGKTPKVFILRMRNVPAIDATGEHALENFYNTCKKAGTQLVLSGVNPAPYATLKKMHFIEMIGEENITNHIDKALIRTKEILKELE